MAVQAGSASEAGLEGLTGAAAAASAVPSGGGLPGGRVRSGVVSYGGGRSPLSIQIARTRTAEPKGGVVLSIGVVTNMDSTESAPVGSVAAERVVQEGSGAAGCYKDAMEVQGMKVATRSGGAGGTAWMDLPSKQRSAAQCRVSPRCEPPRLGMRRRSTAAATWLTGGRGRGRRLCRPPPPGAASMRGPVWGRSAHGRDQQPRGEWL